MTIITGAPTDHLPLCVIACYCACGLITYNNLFLCPPRIVGVFALLLPPCSCLISRPQKVERRSLVLQDALFHQFVRQFLLELPERRSELAAENAAVAPRPRVEQRLKLAGVAAKEAALKVDHEGRIGCGSTVLSGAQVVDGFDFGQKAVLKVLGWKGRCAEIASQYVEFEIVKDDCLVGVELVQLFDIGQFLCRTAQAEVDTGVRDGFDGAAGIATKQAQEQLFGFDETGIIWVGFSDAGDHHTGIGIGTANLFNGQVGFRLIGQQKCNLLDLVVFASCIGGCRHESLGVFEREFEIGLQHVVRTHIVHFQDIGGQRRELDFEQLVSVASGQARCANAVLLQLIERSGRGLLGCECFKLFHVCFGRWRNIVETRCIARSS